MEKFKEKINVIREIFSSEKGYLSSKRILGSIVLLCSLVFIIIEAAREGITDNIKDLFEWLILTSTGLLGISSITGAFASRKKTPNA